MRILEHFFPDHELNLQSLRTIAKAIKDGTFPSAPVQQIDGFFTQQLTSPEDEESLGDGEEQDASELHEPLGCMMRDSMGTFRYVGTHSEIPFNAAIAMLYTEPRNKTIIPSPRLGLYPPSLPAPSPSTDPGRPDPYRLPPRELCDLYVARFLEDVHSMYWLYHVEDLLRRIGEMYTVPTRQTTSTWMCSLYAIFAVGASKNMGATASSPYPDWAAASDRNTAEDYITLAKQLIPSVYDEADVDSIRALAIMVCY
jgi:hypothetical protein